MSGPALTAVMAVSAPAWAALLGLGLARGRDSHLVAAGLGVLGAFVALAAGIAEAALTWDGATQVTRIPLLGTAQTGGSGDLALDLTLRSDALSGLVSVAVALVALCVQIYSAGYLTERYRPYAATVSLFTAAMLLVVHADDIVLLLIGWEVMGICSYLLIGHHSERQAARSAAAKAFLVTRVGDVGFLLGVVVLMASAGTSSITGLLDSAGTIPVGSLTLACLLLLAGVVGKSAQFPLHTWLPDAMEGPTPVSALIHAATMVAAGVYVVARLYPLYTQAPAALVVLGAITAATMLGAALAAFAQSDLKRLLAWSTISQVAIMLSALATGVGRNGQAAAIAHLLSHAAFKALLFLAAGAVIHLVGSNLLRDMGGLRHRAPVVAWTFTIGLVALAGVPPVSGFWSKEAVLSTAEGAVLDAGGAGAAIGWLVLAAGMLTTVVTAAYATRAFCLVVLGPAQRAAAGQHDRLPRSLTWPLVVLAVPSVGLGLLFWAGPAALRGLHLTWLTAVIGTLLVLAGVGLGWTAARRPSRDAADALPVGVRATLAEGYRADEAVAFLVVRPLRRLARTVYSGDRDVVDAYVRGAAVGARWAGRGLRHVQTGLATTYLTWVLAAVVVVGLGVLAW
jgi:NADH-quinone oxidoreductase subunit L